MGTSNRLREQDVTGVFQLVHECGELWADADAWQAHLLGGARRLTGTAVAHYTEARLWPKRRFVEVVDEVHCGWRDDAARAHRERLLKEHPDRAAFMPRLYRLAVACLRAPDVVTVLRPEIRPDSAWYRSPMFNGYHRPACIDGFVMSFALNRRTGKVIFLEVCQDLADPAPTKRAKAILSLLSRQVTPLIGTAWVAGGQRGIRGLSPRLRQTLDAILDGASEKEIALRLGLRSPTVHEYVGALREHFDVSSRAELMAYFVQRKPQPSHASAATAVRRRYVGLTPVSIT
jgi:DNA-binding CsgD family transcriptional regulator